MPVVKRSVQVKLGWVRLLMRMRRDSWVMESSSSRLANLSIRDDGITDCGKSESMGLEW
jgi:hypothetical protein